MKKLFGKYGILGTGALVSGALVATLIASNLIRDGYKSPTGPLVPYEQVDNPSSYVSGYSGEPILEDRLIPEEDLVVDYIAKNYPSAAASEILNDPGANVHYIKNSQDLKDLGIYSAHTDSLLDAHDSLYHIQGNSLVGIDFQYFDDLSGFVEKVDYKTYFGVTKTDSLKSSE
jgi:hypothetical protein